MAKVESTSLFGTTCNFSQVNVIIGSPSTGKSSLLNRIFLDAAVKDSEGDLVPASLEQMTDLPPREGALGLRMKRVSARGVGVEGRVRDLVRQWTGDRLAEVFVSKSNFLEIRSQGVLYSPSVPLRRGLSLAMPASADVVCVDDADAFLEWRVADFVFLCMLEVAKGMNSQVFLVLRHEGSVRSMIRSAGAVGFEGLRFSRLSRSSNVLEFDSFDCSEIQQMIDMGLDPCSTFCKVNADSAGGSP